MLTIIIILINIIIVTIISSSSVIIIRFVNCFLPPTIWPSCVNFNSTNLPKRLELSFITVDALPNASNNGLTWRGE